MKGILRPTNTSHYKIVTFRAKRARYHQWCVIAGNFSIIVRIYGVIKKNEILMKLLKQKNVMK